MKRELIQKLNPYMFNIKEKVIVEPERGYFESLSVDDLITQAKVVSALLTNLHELGYDIPNEEQKELLKLTPQQLKDEIYTPLLAAAKEAKGANVEHKILFTGFPESVIKTDIDTLSDIRFLSYFTSFIDNEFLGIDALKEGSITKKMVSDLLNQDSKESIVGKTDEQSNDYRLIRICKEDEFYDMIKNMLYARSSLSAYQLELMDIVLENLDTKDYMPEIVQFKENQAHIDKRLFEMGRYDQINIKTIDDFERLIATLSKDEIINRIKNQDKARHISRNDTYYNEISIAALENKTIARKFTNQERKALCSILERAIDKKSPMFVESMLNRHAKQFTKNVINNTLHLNSSSKIVANFEKEIKELQTKMSIYEQALLDKNYKKAIDILAKISDTLVIQHSRHIIAGAEAHCYSQLNDILKQIEKSARYVDVNILLNLEKSAEKDVKPYKYIVSTGSNANFIVKENKQLTISKKTQDKLHVAIEKGIKAQLMQMGIPNIEVPKEVQEMKEKEAAIVNKREPAKNPVRVYINPALKGAPIPTVGRGDKGKNRVVAKGTRLPLNLGEKDNTIRLALYKKNDFNQFIDFSAAFLDKDYKFIEQVSWNNLKVEKNNIAPNLLVDGKPLAYHSGDTNSCRNGCTEVIDVNLDTLKKKYPNAEKLVCQALMWNNTEITSCNELFVTVSTTGVAGNIDGKKMTSNPVMDFSKVQIKMDLASPGKANIPLIIDLKNMEVIALNIGTPKRDIKQNLTMNTKHFELPKDCECIENYASTFAHMCNAIDELSSPTIKDLAERHVRYRGMEIVDSPEKADIIWATDRIEVEDKRELYEGIDKLPEQRVISPFDKDVIVGEFIPGIDVRSRATEIEIGISPEQAMQDLSEALEIGNR